MKRLRRESGSSLERAATLMALNFRVQVSRSLVKPRKSAAAIHSDFAGQFIGNYRPRAWSARMGTRHWQDGATNGTPGMMTQGHCHRRRRSRRTPRHVFSNLQIGRLSILDKVLAEGGPYIGGADVNATESTLGWKPDAVPFANLRHVDSLAMDWSFAAKPPRTQVTFDAFERSSGQPRHGERLALVSLTLMTAAAFGPYTPFAGARTEQLAVYGCLVLALPLTWIRLRLTSQGTLFLIIWSFYFVVAAIGVVAPVAGAPWDPGKVLGGADNLLRPIAVFLLASVWMVTTVSRERLLKLACKIVIFAMCSNTILEFIESQIDISQWLSVFWSSIAQDVQSGTVAGRAAQLGRLTGILNQPAEAGTLYGIAMLAALYLWRQRPWRLTIALALLTAGGILTVSKIFLFGALPIMAWQFFRLTEDRPKRFRLAVLAGLTGSFLTIAILLPNWTGSSFLIRYTAPSSNYLAFFSAGRFSPDSSLILIVNTVISISLLTGFGLGGLAVPYDNGWIQALVFAGVLGTIIYTTIFFVLVRAWWMRRQHLTKSEALFAGGLVLLAAGASAGFPALTGNRVATVLWILVSLMLLVPLRGKAEGTNGLTAS
jgi:hypothetical protein